jgi:RNA polymerase sigma-70 factor (ECF subfamily)
MDDKFRQLSDDGLVSRAKRGEQEAYTELVRRVQERIYRTIFAMTRNPEDADDLTQETFMSAYKALKDFRRRSSFYTWVYRIAVNVTLNFLKKKGREKGREDLDEELCSLESGLPSGLSPEEDSMNRELREKLEAAIRNLPLAYRLAFSLVVFDGLPHARAAEILGCSENTVSWRIHKARKML